MRMEFGEEIFTNAEAQITIKFESMDASIQALNIQVYRYETSTKTDIYIHTFTNYNRGCFYAGPNNVYADVSIVTLPNAAAELGFDIREKGLLRITLAPVSGFRRVELLADLNKCNIKDAVIAETYETASKTHSISSQSMHDMMEKIANSTKPPSTPVTVMPKSQSTEATPAAFTKRSMILDRIDVDVKTSPSSLNSSLTFDSVNRLRRSAGVDAASKIKTCTSYFNNLQASPKRLASVTTSTSKRNNGDEIDWSLCEPAPVANPQLLFIFPDDVEEKCENFTGAVAITSAERPRLEPGIFLNDRLIDFDLMQTQGMYQPRPDVHVFCCLFFRELKTRGREGVKKWSPPDLFKKRYLVIPVNEYLHWYLVIVCNPQRLLVDLSKRGKKVCQVSASSEEEEEDVEEMETITPEDKCFILILDSLGSRARPTTIDTLSKYLAAEALEKHNVQINTKLLTGISPKVPQQDNHTDCGLFLLEFFERFIGRPEEFEQMALRRTGSYYHGLKEWFEPRLASQRREALKTRVLEQQALYQQNHPLMSEVMIESASSDLEIIE
jgi:hypothetical protein